MVEKKWVQRKVSEEKVNELVIELGLHRLLSRVLVARGIDSSEKVKAFFNPKLSQLGDPFMFAGMEAACNRFLRAIEIGEVIGIFGDYDVDGVTSTTLLSEFLESLGVKVCATIPDRLKEGYGLSVEGLDRLKSQGATLVVTVDCGITAHEEVEAATKRGVDVIVVDHHTVPVDLPRACAVINPHRPDCKRDAQHLCAVGVVFNLCMALRKKLRDEGFFKNKAEPNLSRFLDLVALGTVADVMPLQKENRIFVKHGIQVIKSEKRLGMRALLQTSKILPQKVTASTLGFHLGPRINAAGRLEDAMQAVHLLRQTNKEKALEVATRLHESNLKRRNIEKQIVEEAVEEIENSELHESAMVLVVAKPSWHPGVVGIVASRLVDKFGKPAIVIGENGKGSGRSIPAFHLHENLCKIKEEMVGFGGHAHAVGVHIELQNIDKFRLKLNQVALSVLKSEDLIRLLSYDDQVSVEDLTEDLVGKLELATPFGRGNPEPVFRLNNVHFSDLRELQGGHVKGKLKSREPLSFIAFGLAEKMKQFEEKASILFSLEKNEWRGKTEIQLRVRDIASAI